jgi:hypothetical protein
MLDRYRAAVARGGWRLPAVPVLNALFDTAECARYADRIIWPAIALLGGDWDGSALRHRGWFAALEPLRVSGRGVGTMRAWAKCRVRATRRFADTHRARTPKGGLVLASFSSEP